MRRTLVPVAVAVGVVGCLAAAAAAYVGYRSYSEYASSAEQGVQQFQFHTWFVNPQNGSTLPASDPVQIHARAESNHVITAVELWIDGELAQVLEAPTEDQQSPFDAQFAWLPEAPGSYSLIARAFDGNGDSSNSSVLFLEISDEVAAQTPELNAAYGPPSQGFSQPAGDGGGGPIVPYSPPPESPPAPDDGGGNGEDQTPVQLWQPTLVGWIGGLLSPVSTTPMAPSLSTAVESCRPRLFIGDHSENESGFHVYRMDPGQASFSLIASLAAHDGPAFSFDDEELYGTFHYYVSAFNGNGEADSEIRPVEVLSENCAPEEQLALAINLDQLLSENPYEQGYCYYSFDLVHWQRHPAAPDAFFPTGEASDPAFMELVKLADSDGAAPFKLECWGWQNGGLNMLGEWTWGNVFEIGSTPEMFPMDGDMDSPLDFDIFASADDFGPFTMKYNLSVPGLVAWVGHTPEECAAWSNIPNPILMGLLCADIAEELDFLVWQLEAGCPAQFTNPQAPCYGPDDIDHYNVYDTMHDGGETPIQTIDAPATLYFLFDADSCAPRMMWVSAVVEANGEDQEGPTSNHVYYPGNPLCPVLLGEAPQHFRLVWDTIDFSVGNIDDGVDPSDDAEGYGTFGVWNTSVVPLTWTMSYDSNDDVPHFDDDDSENPYHFSNLPLCKGGGYPTYCSVGWESLLNNHTAEFDLYLNERIDIYMLLYDRDDDGYDDVLCSLDPYVDDLIFRADHVFFAGESVTFTRTRHHNNASCRVTFHIEALP